MGGEWFCQWIHMKKTWYQSWPVCTIDTRKGYCIFHIGAHARTHRSPIGGITYVLYYEIKTKGDCVFLLFISASHSICFQLFLFLFGRFWLICFLKKEKKNSSVFRICFRKKKNIQNLFLKRTVLFLKKKNVQRTI